ITTPTFSGPRRAPASKIERPFFSVNPSKRPSSSVFYKGYARTLVLRNVEPTPARSAENPPDAPPGQPLAIPGAGRRSGGGQAGGRRRWLVPAVPFRGAPRPPPDGRLDLGDMAVEAARVRGVPRRRR